jgi:hypothetical protein
MKFKNTRTQQVNLVTEKEFGGNVIGGGYVGSRGAHVAFAITNLDLARAGPGPVQQRRTCFAQLPKVTTIGLFESVEDTPSFANPNASLGAPGFGSITTLGQRGAVHLRRRRPPARGGPRRRRKFAAEHAARVRRPLCRVCSTREVNRAIEEE